ncbi:MULTISPECIES: response regulator transcription factor [Marinifilum]|uniref:LuxR family two component transcriptional regulator n=1 Tax=Marinifilum flexuosum TaxID=1117708 RepID=A0A419X6A9_9BACT|nr:MULTISPECIES: response regulator transcription factor [Marinifilum]MCY1636433.1 response regulator transcription factor [Marinifilum sp. D737]RKE03294.1 LuxR family two component transcriptional regulator [Marinifilum flexuosum]
MEENKVIIVDDHKMFRSGLRFLLSNIPNITVIGEASNGKEFLEMAENETIDIALMDINMPEMNGIDATRIAMEKYPDLKVIVLSMHGEEEYYDQMLDAGVKGFLLKNSDADELIAAIEAVIAGKSYFSQELLVDILDQKRLQKLRTDAVKLSTRELEVLKLICDGFSNAEIAEQLFISHRTVDRHRANLLSKTGCKNSTSLVMYAVKNKIVEIE